MARASVKLTCKKCNGEFSHVKHNLYNRMAADSYETWARDNITTCPECWKAEQEVKRQEARKAEEAKTQELAASCPWTLPALEGSEKQIAWATDIRKNFVVQLAGKKAKWQNLEQVGNGGTVDGMPEEVANTIKGIYVAIFNTSSKWWIENRGKSFAEGKFVIGGK